MKTAPLNIYLIAIGGTGMAPLACLLQEQGHHVAGADRPLYPPMSTLLEDSGITPFVGFDARHLEPMPDLVVVGNAVPRDHPEAVEVERRDIARVSMPEALARFFLADRQPLVVAGTHGKTTTTAMAAWVFSRCGADPGYFIGGVPLDLRRSFAIGTGSRFIVEGDEYNAAYFDRGPKFLHYRAQTLILTSAEYDHADLYPEPQALTGAYRALIRRLPEKALLIACGDTSEVRELAREASCRVLLYGLERSNDVRPASGVDQTAEASRFSIEDGEAEPVAVELKMPGLHNVSNALAVWAAARADGLAAAQVASALGSFRGVRRRLEEVGCVDGVLVIEDFAHHPTAVAATLEALRQRYPHRRVTVLYEPRSLTAGRSFLFEAYREALLAADEVHLAPIHHFHRLAPEERLDLAALASRLGKSGVAASCWGSVEELLEAVVAKARSGDLLVTMSSGDFQGLPRRLVAALEARFSTLVP